MQAHEDDIARYKGAYDVGGQAIRERRYQRQIQMGLISPDWNLPEMEPPADWQVAEHLAWHERRMEVYAAMVDRMDQGIGRIVKVMRDRNAFNNTIVFFLSDNGGSQEEVQADTGFMVSVMPDAARNGSPIRGGNDPTIMPGPETTFQTVGHDWGNVNNTPFRYGKVRVHEGGIASPLIVHWPDGIGDRGSLRHPMTHVIDLLPTCMELAGGTYPGEYRGHVTETLQGLSLAPSFADQKLDRDTLFFEMGGNRAVRYGKWRAVAKEGLGKEFREKVKIPLDQWELYDMRNDRTETKNVAADHPLVLREMVQQWEQWIGMPGD
jgi:arylsulfatase